MVKGGCSLQFSFLPFLTGQAGFCFFLDFCICGCTYIPHSMSDIVEALTSVPSIVRSCLPTQVMLPLCWHYFAWCIIIFGVMKSTGEA